MGIEKEITIEVSDYEIARYIACYIDCEDFMQILNYIGDEKKRP